MLTTPYIVDLQDYRTELTSYLSDAWLLAKEHITHAQDKQKQECDKQAKESPVKVGDRVMVYMPGSVKGKAWKLARPFHGCYRVIHVSLTPTNAEVRLVRNASCAPGLVDQPGSDTSHWSGSSKQRRNTFKNQSN